MDPVPKHPTFDLSSKSLSLPGQHQPSRLRHRSVLTKTTEMGKRAADDADEMPGVLKEGERPVKPDTSDEAGDFEDEFEDEYESEDEIFEAGVDGRPDAEREAEESRGMWFTPVALCDLNGNRCSYRWLIGLQMLWKWTGRHSYPAEISYRQENRCLQISPPTKCFTP